jgi:hypothetical protein
MDLAEIAQILRKTRTHVKVILFRARQTLFQKLEMRQTGESSNHDVERKAQSQKSEAQSPQAKVSSAQAIVQTTSFSFHPPSL